LWDDPACIYIERANSKYDIEFEVVLDEASDINKYLETFSEHKIAVLTENLYTNLYPLNKIANFKDIGDALESQKGEVVDLRNSKLWYLNYQGAESYLKIYENKEYFEVMEKSEQDLFGDISDFIREKYPHETFSVTDVGSGNGLKGRVFIEKLGEKSVKAYYPIDIQPIELEAALAAHADGTYSKHPTLLDIENLSARFPLALPPHERQVNMFLGGTYGNFRAREINGYLKPMIGGSSLLLVAMPIVGGIKTDKEIADSYANVMAENTAFGPLAQLGFTKDDFEQNPQYPNLKVHISMEDRRNILSFILRRDVNVFGRAFRKGTAFKVITSWKPTLDEFRAALEEDFTVEKIFHNRDMAIAVISGLREGIK
jgi:SAM-dependent methyltransferase